ncbi:PREDICTED: proteinase-activated receptor 1-like [Nanorana parkeri]|uniref:proteinase-activated receptor 1-like n=1 Tax=Nanorana parkeri TaxID=125878 RepID=UPI000854A0AA|nr:PREDICTED: proteinase-activated receptor 1-like [Nanorana parkeri]
MAIVMFLVKMKVRKPAVVFMLNLATADVLLIGVLPFYIVYRFSGSHWLFGEGMCRFVMAAYYCNMFCSSLLMTSISVDRFLAVVYPVRSLPWRSVKRAWLVCGVIWVISFASTVPLLLRKQTYTFPARDITVCHDYQHYWSNFSLSFPYFSPAFSLFIFLPLLITTFCYIRIIRSLSRSQFDGRHKRLRAIRLSVVVLCVFVLCFGPTNVIYLVYLVRTIVYDDPVLYIAYIVSSCISSINCCLDPLIYYFASSQCQRYVCSLLGRKKDYRPPVEQMLERVHKDQQPERTHSTPITGSG